jgi:predicted RNA binding protein YcfA (HicA-like mRNA interferase family)
MFVYIIDNAEFNIGAMKDPPTETLVAQSTVPKDSPKCFDKRKIGRVLRLNARQVESILKQYGFKIVPGQGKGSHRKWRHPEKKCQTIVPYHDNGNATLRTGTLSSIFKQAGIPESAWRS